MILLFFVFLPLTTRLFLAVLALTVFPRRFVTVFLRRFLVDRLRTGWERLRLTPRRDLGRRDVAPRPETTLATSSLAPCFPLRLTDVFNDSPPITSAATFAAKLFVAGTKYFFNIGTSFAPYLVIKLLMKPSP